MARWSIVSGTPTLAGNVFRPAFSPDDAYLAVPHHGSSPYFTVLDTSDWSVVAGTPAMPNVAVAAAYSPSGNHIAVAHLDSPYLTIVDASDWSVVAGTPTLAGVGRDVAFSDNGTYLAVAHDNSPYLTIIDTSDWSVIAGTPTLAGKGEACDFRPDSAFLAVAHDTSPGLTIIDTSDWSVVAGTPVLPANGRTLSFNDSGSLLAVGHDNASTPPPEVQIVDTSDWSVVSSTYLFDSHANDVDFSPDDLYLAAALQGGSDLEIVYTGDWTAESGDHTTISSTCLGAEFSHDGKYLAVGRTVSPYLTIVEREFDRLEATLDDTTALFVQAGGDIAGALQPTTVSMSGSAVVAGDIAVTLDNTVTGFAGDVVYEGDIAASLADTQALFQQEFIGDVAFTLDDTQAEFLVGTPEDVMLAGTVQTLVDTSLAALVSEVATSTLIKQTFYQTSEEPLLTAAGTDSYEIAFVVEELLAATAQLDLQERISVYEWLRGLSVLETETFVRYMIDELIRAEAVDSAIAAHAMSEVLASIASDSVLALQAANVIEEMTAALVAVNTLHLIVEETLEAEATDSQESLAHYMQNVNELAGARLLFKLSDEVVQAWVMNVEGERPMSQYENFDFTSYCEIDGVWFATDDEGVYRLGGDTDDGADIGARLRSLIMDFGTSRLKRVVSAYMGYTASGKLVFRLRSVDQGQLVEHWYEAKQLTAEAPRQGRIAVGRGLRSRYWQFEIVNVDGADFELGKVELHPLLLDRRV